MLLKLGTYKWHIAVEILYYYEEPKQLNLFGITTPLFVFVISLWKPAILAKWEYPSCKFYRRWTSKKR